MVAQIIKDNGWVEQRCSDAKLLKLIREGVDLDQPLDRKIVLSLSEEDGRVRFDILPYIDLYPHELPEIPKQPGLDVCKESFEDAYREPVRALLAAAIGLYRLGLGDCRIQKDAYRTLGMAIQGLETIAKRAPAAGCPASDSRHPRLAAHSIDATGTASPAPRCGSAERGSRDDLTVAIVPLLDHLRQKQEELFTRAEASGCHPRDLNARLMSDHRTQCRRGDHAGDSCKER